jgi:hypothetical protein
VWTDDFIPSTTETSKPSFYSSNKLTIIGGTIGSLTGVILLGIGGWFLYKWNKNKQMQKKKDAIPIPGEAERNDYHASLVINIKSNPKQETIPIVNDKRSPASQNMDDNDVVQQLKNEIQSLRHELRQQNSNEQVSDFKNT